MSIKFKFILLCIALILTIILGTIIKDSTIAVIMVIPILISLLVSVIILLKKHKKINS